jgi:hypothetical protein
MLTVLFVVVIAAFACTIASALNKCPVWVPVLLLCVAALLQILPAR